ncbi:11455_t:CDS:2 [Racocetra fulgida]|uniref:11455_t:CDS:1 n=1 Tax=Racocetra fulgida TaxID=60492 RepID=A0A9N9GRF2_9GLOM|nr:11455_t:CDS:2 [Racocetra fulgida]
MDFLKYITFISVLTYLFVLVTSVEPTTEDDRVVFNVILKSESGRNKHYEWLKNNHNIIVGKSKQNILSIKNKNFVKDFSVDGFYGYTGWFTQEFASKTLKQRDEVAVVEQDIKMKINYVVPPGKNFGVAKKSTVISVRVLDPFGGGTASVVSAGIFSIFDVSALAGTSQATPFVAGAIALIIAKNGNKSPEKMATALNDLSTKNAIDFGGNQTIVIGTPNNLLRVPAP